MTTTKFQSYYFDSALFDLAGVIEQAKADLEGVDFDTIVGTGFSGSVVIPALALAMGKEFVLIRKENDDSHHGGGRMIGQLGERWIFVDDFISSGRTRERVIRKVANSRVGRRKIGSTGVVMVGQYMYQHWEGPTYTPFKADWIPEDMR